MSYLNFKRRGHTFTRLFEELKSMHRVLAEEGWSLREADVLKQQYAVAIVFFLFTCFFSSYWTFTGAEMVLV